jgi:hypothetical protein
MITKCGSFFNNNCTKMKKEKLKKIDKSKFEKSKITGLNKIKGGDAYCTGPNYELGYHGDCCRDGVMEYGWVIC